MEYGRKERMASRLKLNISDLDDEIAALGEKLSRLQGGDLAEGQALLEQMVARKAHLDATLGKVQD